MKKSLFVLIVLSVQQESYSQKGEGLFSFNYLMTPIGNDDIDLYKTDIKLNIPIKIKKGVLVNSFGFDNFNFNYSNSPVQASEIDSFYNIRYGVSYTYPISEKWKLSSRVGLSISSNLEGAITSEDLNYNLGLMGLRTFGKKQSPSILMFGLAYATISGRPRLLPLISYTKILNQKFSFGIGFPRTYAKYQLNERSVFSTEIALNGFYSNLSNPLAIDANNISEKASLTTVNLGVSYDYHLDKNWSINFKGGYSIFNSYKLLNADNESVYNFDTSPKPYFSTGIKFRLNNKQKQKQNDR